MKVKKVKCPCCHGTGNIFNPIIYNGIGGGENLECAYCNGDGKVSQKIRMVYVRDRKGLKIIKL